MKGKTICKSLKEIRRQIAEQNDIEYVTSECHYQGECLGTCPKCEAELAWLEKQLKVRQQLGKAVVLTGIAIGVPILTGCDSSQANPIEEKLTGDIAAPDSEVENEVPLSGDISLMPEAEANGE